jgi:hypothetical protein
MGTYTAQPIGPNRPSHDCENCSSPKRLTCTVCLLQLCVPCSDMANSNNPGCYCDCNNIGHYNYNDKPYCTSCYSKINK